MPDDASPDDTSRDDASTSGDANPSGGRTEQIPMFPLGTVLVPGMPLALHIFEPRYRQLVADLLDAEDPAAPFFGVVALRHGTEVGEVGDLYEVGTVARVTDVRPHPDGRCDLAAEGEERFQILALDTVTRPYLVATVRYLPERDGLIDAEIAAHVRRLLRLHRAVLAAIGVELDEPSLPTLPTDPHELSYLVARLPTLPLPDRQVLLARAETAERLITARSLLRRETELLRQLRAIPVTAAAFRTGFRSS